MLSLYLTISVACVVLMTQIYRRWSSRARARAHRHVRLQAIESLMRSDVLRSADHYKTVSR